MKRLNIVFTNTCSDLLHAISAESRISISELVEDSLWRSPEFRRACKEKGILQPKRTPVGRPQSVPGPREK